jgi:hypothetical protein
VRANAARQSQVLVQVRPFGPLLQVVVQDLDWASASAAAAAIHSTVRVAISILRISELLLDG